MNARLEAALLHIRTGDFSRRQRQALIYALAALAGEEMPPLERRSVRVRWRTPLKWAWSLRSRATVLLRSLHQQEKCSERLTASGLGLVVSPRCGPKAVIFEEVTTGTTTTFFV